MNTLNDYRKIVGDKKINEIINEAKPLKGKYVTHINSTFYGGGVAEILSSLVFLMNDVGIKAEWRLLRGDKNFFNITKSFHNGLQGSDIKLTEKNKKIYEKINYLNSLFIHLEKSDIVIAHDVQVLPLIKFFKKTQPWIWRCHVDISNQNKKLWKYLTGFINLYDNIIISDKNYIKNDINTEQKIIMPSIDPLSDKNKNLSLKKAKAILSDFNIKFNKPIISQISRYDIWKDPVGVVDTFLLIKKKIDCQLILLGNTSIDDPEGDKIYKQVIKKTKNIKDCIVLLNVENNDIVVNALQRMSDVVLQKSLKEGFALTVSEALWKGTPVVGSNVGGIPNQIINGKNGYLVNSIKECAEKTIKILQDNNLRKKMGEYAYEYVKENFLITRHLLDYIKIINF